jgi:UDP-N-acetylglucosamine--N-acetylmuramyl-(pentapeptide) pyrophosphoryl-undecaprenol N-acetylglucosamine transferase
MTYAIAAAGTGGHVYPALAVAEALVSEGTPRSDVVFLGGNRLEATVFPDAGFPFVQLDLQSLQRRLTSRNLLLPAVLRRAVQTARRELVERDAGVVLGMGSYVTVPVGWAARSANIPLFLHEQNAKAGLANRVMSRVAEQSFVSFAETAGLRRQVLVGNPVRANLAGFSRAQLRHEALARYRLTPGLVVVGVFGGSLGAGVINQALTAMASGWDGPPVQILHLAGSVHADDMEAVSEKADVPWIVLGFEEEMQYFYAACDIVISRAGGAVAELAVTGTPAVLVPGTFGGGHQLVNAERFEAAGAAVVVPEEQLSRLGERVRKLVEDSQLRRTMADRSRALAHPEAARDVATRLRVAHG